jgi:small subunit ribosomal protein S7
MEVRPSRRDSLARRWLVSFARGRTGKTMADRLAAELLDAARGDGGAVRRKDEVHRMAEANKAFAHYRW